MPLSNIVSVIIPTYNRSSFIQDAINSVISQQIPKGWELEVIVVDDGSTDNTKSVIKPYLSRIKYIEIPHSGKPAVPRNVGINAAKGSLIAFQDSDDLWPVEKLGLQIKIFSDPTVMMTYGNANTVNHYGEPNSNLVVDSNKLSDGEKFQKLLLHNVISTLTVVVRSTIFKEVGNFNESLNLRAIEDYELWLRILARFPNGVRSIPKVLASYRMHSQNISSNNDIGAIEKIQAVYDSLWEVTTLTNTQRLSLEKQMHEMHKNWSRLTCEKQGAGIPKISVIMSTYNASEFLRPAMKSILGQSLGDFEFIIVDDGSTDDSYWILRSYKDSRIRIIRQSNHGLVYSLNKAIGLARGQFIARMDADDISLPKRLKKEYEWISKDINRALVSTFFEHIEHKTSKPTGTKIIFPIDSIDLKRALYFTNPFAHGAAMYRKDAVLKSGLYSSSYGPTEDYELWRRMAKEYEVGLIPEVLFQYRINNPASESQSKNALQTKFVSKIQDELWNEKFYSKSILQIILDYYRINPATYKNMASGVKDVYISHQFTLAKFSLLRGYVLRGTKIALAILLISPKHTLLLMKYLPKSIKLKVKRLV